MLSGLITSLILLSATPQPRIAPESVFPATQAETQQLIAAAPERLSGPVLPEYLSLRLSEKMQVDAWGQSYDGEEHEVNVGISILF